MTAAARSAVKVRLDQLARERERRPSGSWNGHDPALNAVAWMPYARLVQAPSIYAALVAENGASHD